MKIKVYSIAVDGKCGTVGGAYATEREAWGAVLDAAINNDETRAEAQAMLDAGVTDFDDFLDDHTDGLTTWQVDEAEIEVPIVDELVGALGNAYESFDDAFADIRREGSISPETAQRFRSGRQDATAAMAKAKEASR
jgi:hypothetical protein